MVRLHCPQNNTGGGGHCLLEVALSSYLMYADNRARCDDLVHHIKVLGDGGEDEVEVDTVDENEGGETREVDALKEEGEMDIHELLVREYGAEAAAAMVAAMAGGGGAAAAAASAGEKQKPLSQLAALLGYEPLSRSLLVRSRGP